MENRIIKFRGRCEISKEFVFGDLIHGVGYKKGSLYILPNEVNLAYVKHCDPLDGVKIIPESVGRFTGRVDKNQVEVYVGDIFEDVLKSKTNGVVTDGEYQHCFDKEELKSFGSHVGFYVDFGHPLIRKDLGYWSRHSQIIGNIHENNELL